MQFSELNLEPSLTSAIAKLGYTNCTPIQEAVMPAIFEGRDVSGLAQTGTGKTAAFLLPLMDRLLKSRVQTENLSADQKEFLFKRSFKEWRAQNFILVLVPTRELAEQVCENISSLAVDCGLKGFPIYGGTGYDKQKEAVKNGLDFIVATPGRLIDLYKEHVVDLKQVRAVVFDEADRMFDMGFKDDMKYILQRIPQERQFLVFSATLNFDVLNTAYQFGAEPLEIDVSRDQTKAENVKDEIFHVGQNEKQMYLLSLLKKHNPKQAIIFSNFKMSVEKIARFLSDNGIPAMGISSLLTQGQRLRVIEQFKAENEKNILVATDVAARGLDIKGVDLVINFELPNDAESYVHRIGRTGRANTEGQAYSLVSDRDVDSLNRIQDYLKNKVEIGWLEDSDLIKDFKPMKENDYSERPHKKPFDRERSHDRGSFKGKPTHKRHASQSDSRHEHKKSDFKKRPEHSPHQKNQNSQKNGRKPFHKNQKPNSSHSKHAHRQHRPNPALIAAKNKKQQNQGLVSKVTGFFKKLFE